MFFAACGDGKKAAPTEKQTDPATISISQPSSARVGELKTLTVTRRNTPDFNLTVTPASGSGCGKRNVDTVDCTPTAAGTYAITVTATADATVKAIATLTVNPAIVGTEMKIPVTIALSQSIAGAEFEFTYTGGLEFNSFEKSAATQSAMLLPPAVRNGKTYVGFAAANNNFVPQGGALNAGNLVFSMTPGAAGQSATMTKVKLVRVVGADVIDEDINVNSTVQIPMTAGGQGFRIGF